MMNLKEVESRIAEEKARYSELEKYLRSKNIEIRRDAREISLQIRYSLKWLEDKKEELENE